MTANSKTKTSFYRRLYVAWLIHQGIDTVPKLMEATGMPRRTAQDTLAALQELAIETDNSHGRYRVTSWGAVNPLWVDENLAHLKIVLNYP